MHYEKSTQKQAMILQKAREVFAAKGYAKVTMQDIVAACGISRGGLYRYFNSTSEIFLAVFVSEAREQKTAVETALWEKRPADEILLELIYRIEKELCSRGSALAMATYEFFIENHEEQLIYRWQFDDLSELFREIIVQGIEEGVFASVDAAAWGRHLAFWLNGLRLTLPVLEMPDQRIREEIDMMLQPLLNTEEKLNIH